MIRVVIDVNPKATPPPTPAPTPSPVATPPTPADAQARQDRRSQARSHPRAPPDRFARRRRGIGRQRRRIGRTAGDRARSTTARGTGPVDRPADGLDRTAGGRGGRPDQPRAGGLRHHDGQHRGLRRRDGGGVRRVRLAGAGARASVPGLIVVVAVFLQVLGGPGVAAADPAPAGRERRGRRLDASGSPRLDSAPTSRIRALIGTSTRRAPFRETRRLVEAGMAAAANGPGSHRTEREAAQPRTTSRLRRRAPAIEGSADRSIGWRRPATSAGQSAAHRRMRVAPRKARPFVPMR